MRRSPELMKQLGRRLKEAREEAGFTRRQMEEELKRRGLIEGDARTANLSRWETGTMMPALEILATYAEMTGKSMEWFTGEKTAEDLAEAATAAVVRMWSDIMAGQQPDEAYRGEFGAEGAMHPLLLQLIHTAGDTLRAAVEQYAGRPWSQIATRDRERILDEYVRHMLGRRNQGRSGGASDGRDQSPPAKTESKTQS